MKAMSSRVFVAARRLGLTTLLFVLVAGELLAADPHWVQRIQRPQYIALSVEDVDASAAWYQRVLALNTLDDMTSGDGGWRIQNLTNDDFFLELIWSEEDRSVENARGIVKFGFRVPDVVVVADRVEAATGERPQVLEFERHGVRLVQLHDPDGNILQLTSPLPNSDSSD